MLEPHVFCGPDFLLRVPRDRASDVCEAFVTRPAALRAEVLRQIQQDIYALLSPAVKGKVTASGGSGGAGPPSSLAFVETAPLPTAPVAAAAVKASAGGGPTASLADFLGGESAPEEQRPDALTSSTPARGTPEAEAGGSVEGFEEMLLRVTDSRVAGEVLLIVLRNPFIAVSHRMRVQYLAPPTAASASALQAKSAPSSSSSPSSLGDGDAMVRAAQLAKVEALRRRMNMDEDLWELLETGLTTAFLEPFEAIASASTTTAAPGATNTVPMTSALRRQRLVEAILAYCEKHATYAGVMDNDGARSPFLLAMGLIYRYRVTYEDLYRHFITHTRRCVRALALFTVRYLAPPEEVEVFFAPCIHDEVTIACTEDGSVSMCMSQLCRELLLNDEVCEAWPPTYHAMWLARCVQPALERMEAQHAQRLARSAGDPAHGDSPSSTSRGPRAGALSLRGTGVGVAGLGFRSLRDLHEYVRERERVLIPQRVTVLGGADGFGTSDVLSRLMGAGGNGGDDDVDHPDDDGDEFLIHVEVGDANGNPIAMAGASRAGATPFTSVAAAAPAAAPSSAARPVVGSAAVGRRKRTRNDVVVDVRRLATSEAYRVLLGVLGRTKPFDARDEHYVEF